MLWIFASGGGFQGREDGGRSGFTVVLQIALDIIPDL
jgi:hypothetical protein